MTWMFSMWLCLVQRYMTSLVRLPTLQINCKNSMMYVLIPIHTHTRSIAYRKHCMENFILWFIYQHLRKLIPWQCSLLSNFFATVNCYHVSFTFQTGVIDMDNDWKLLTLLIGGNDLCDRWVMWADTKYVHNQYFHSVISWVVSGKIVLTLASFPSSVTHAAWKHGYIVDT